MSQHRKTSTKSDIKAAFTQLLTSQDFDSLTISDMTRVAGINRGTFYLHYTDKFDLLDQLLEDLFTQLADILYINQSRSHYLQPLIVALEFIQADFAFVYAVSQSRPNDLDRHIRRFLLQLIDETTELKWVIEHNPVLPPDYATELFMVSIVGLMMYWIRNGAQGDPQEMAQMMIASQVLAHGSYETDFPKQRKQEQNYE